MTSIVLENKRLNPKLIRRRSVLATWPGVDPPEAEVDTVSTELEVDSKIRSSQESNHSTLPAEKMAVKEISDDRLSSISDAEQKNNELHSAFNAPMLINWLGKHYDELSTVISGLEFTLHHAQKGDGCVLLLKYGVLRALLKIQRHDAYSDEKNVQLLCVQIFKQLLECNYTRDPLIITSEVLRITFSIGEYLFYSLLSIIDNFMI